MTVHLVTFSDESMSRSRDLCVDSAMDHGVDGITWAFAATDEDKAAGRGLGFWAWKPRIILDFLTDTTGGIAHPDEGDILIYSDAGVEFINNVSHIIDRMDQDIFLFGNNWEHAHWCKRDVIDAIIPRDYGNPVLGGWLDHQLAWAPFGKQVQASVIFFRVSDYTLKFVKEWLDWCLSGARIGAALTFGKDNPEHRDECATWSEFRYLIDDSPSVLPNHPEFREHRHDQAILTTMAYREGIRLHYWPAVYNKGGSPEFVYEKLPEYAGDSYPVIFSHHRKRNHEWSAAA